MEVQVDKGVKVEPSGRVSLKNSDKVVIGIRKSDSLPEIWVMATKPELKQKVVLIGAKNVIKTCPSTSESAIS